MRERLARLLAFSTGALVLLLAAVFTLVQNPVWPPLAVAKPSPSASRDVAATLAAGREVFAAQGCAGCHSVAGQGSPRSPLDGVGSALSREEIRQWVLGDAAISDDLSPRALAAKQAYASLPAAEFDALLDYLQSLQAPAPR